MSPPVAHCGLCGWIGPLGSHGCHARLAWRVRAMDVTALDDLALEAWRAALQVAHDRAGGELVRRAAVEVAP